MILKNRLMLPLVATLVLAAAPVHATNITIPDLVGSGSGWYGAQEDQEVEPGCVQAQRWDLEGFYLDGSILAMVGGYDFAAGQDGFLSGDLFLDVDGDVVFGTDNFGRTGDNGYYNVGNRWGYDYAINLNFANSTYTVLAIDSGTLVTAYYRQNDESNPWRYSGGGTQVTTGGFAYATGLASYDAQTGGTHNVVSLDLGGFLDPGTDFTAHFTMGCGNDNLMGRGTTASVPEPGTLMLLGAGLVGLAGIRRRKRV